MKPARRRSSSAAAPTARRRNERCENGSSNASKGSPSDCPKMRTEALRPGRDRARIGRLLGKNTRAARLFSVQVGRDESGRVVVTWSRKASALESAKRREGCYLLRSNVSDWTAEDLWKAYMQLTEAEAAFRIQKDELRLRPVWHQTAERVQAHILVCFLAYVLRKTLEGWSQRAGLGRSIPTLLEEFARIQSTDWSCRPPTAAPYGCGAWCDPTRRRRSCSNTWAWNFPNGYGSQKESLICSANF